MRSRSPTTPRRARLNSTTAGRMRIVKLARPHVGPCFDCIRFLTRKHEKMFDAKHQRGSGLRKESDMTAEMMREKIVAAVYAGRKGTSFAEVLESCGVEARGDQTLELQDNLVLWHGVSAL